MIEKFKLAELLEKHKFMEKRKAAEYEAETLQIQQQVAKAKGPPKILEELNKEGKEKVSKTFLYAEDGNIPLQQQKEYDYSELATKLTSQSPELYSLVVDNRPSNDLSDECRSPRLSYDIPPKSEFDHRGGHLDGMNFPVKRESLHNSQIATNVLCWLLQQEAAPEVDMEAFDGDFLNFKYFVSSFSNILDDQRGQKRIW